MQVSVAVYTFVATIFGIFVLWGTKNLGILGLLSSFSIGIIAYSLADSLEIAVASIILSGILLKFLYPYIEKKWTEGYHNYTAEQTVERIQGMNEDFRRQNASGLAPQLAEGFQVGNTPNTQGAMGAMAAPNMQGAMAAPNMQRAMGATAGIPAMAGMATPNMQSNMQGGMATPNMQPNMQGAMGAMGAMSAPNTGAAVMMPNMGSSGAAAVPLPSAPSANMSAIEGTNLTAKTGSEPAPVLGTPQVNTTQATTNAAGSPAAAAGAVTPSTLTTGAVGTPATAGMAGATAGGVEATTTSAFTNMADNGMFKLGELPSAAKGGPHIDAGTTIMRALGALNPDQISSLTDDTRKLVDTQKSLMNMLTTMKPMLSDGQNLLSSFTNMFGKQ